MSAYREHFAEHLRLTILRLLAEMPSFSANSSVITDAAHEMGLVATRDIVRTELAWLAEQGLISTREPAPGLVVATTTERGLDVAAGRAIVPGVQRPGPGKA